MTIKSIVFCEAIHYIANCVFEIINQQMLTDYVKLQYSDNIHV